jgi:hypothetical protein
MNWIWERRIALMKKPQPESGLGLSVLGTAAKQSTYASSNPGYNLSRPLRPRSECWVSL